MKSLVKLTTLAAMTSCALAGSPEVTTSTPISTPSTDPWLTGTATLGFESSYYFRGLWFSNNNLFGSATFSAPLTDKLTLGFGALYTETLDTNIGGVGPANSSLDYSEMDLFANLSYAHDFATFGLAFTGYQFFDTFSGEINGASTGGVYDARVQNAFDIGLTMAKPFLDGFNLYTGAWFDTKIDGWYFEVGVDYTYEVSDKLSLVALVQTGYAIEYYTMDASDNWGMTHIRTSINAPYKVTDCLTVNPYIAMNMALEARKNLNVNEATNDLFGGLTVSYSF